MQNKNNSTSTANIRRDTDVFAGIVPLSPSPVNHDMNQQQPSQSSSPETISNDESNGNQQNSPVTLRFSVVMGHL